MQYKKFINSEFSNKEEESYLNSIFETHFDAMFRQKYSSTLKSKYNVDRNQGGKAAESKNRINYFKLIMSVAAIFLVAVLSVPFLGNDNLNTVSSGYIESDFFTNKNLKRGDNTNEFLRNNAIIAYNDKRFEEALSNYENIVDPNLEDQFFMALSQMYSGSFQKANTAFQDLYDSDSFKYREELKWFYSLSLIKSGKTDEAKIILNTILTWRKKEASKLLSKMK